MRAIPRLLIAPLLLAVPLAACDPRAEEESSLPAQDLSPAEVIQRVLDAEKSITSVREERTEVSTQIALPTSVENTDGTPEQSRVLRIQVGDDTYEKYEFVPPPDFCEGDPDCLDSFSPLDEALYYNGNTYYRDRSGIRWVLEPEFGCPGDDPSIACERLSIEHSGEVAVGTGGFVECPALESTDPAEFTQIYSFGFSWLADPQRIESGSDDASLLRLRGIIGEPFWSLGLTPEIEATYAECGIDPTELFDRAEIPAQIRDYIPERYEGVADIWVDPTTYFVHRIDWSLNMINGDRVIQTETTSSRYSLFNEAELPGPLPE